MTQKAFKVTISQGKTGLSNVAKEKVVAFSQRLNEAMKEVSRESQKKQKKSAERAAKIVLNA